MRPLLPEQNRAAMNRKLKITLLAALLLAVYPLATWLALNKFQDNPADMVWTDREAFNRKFIAALNLEAKLQQEQVQQKLGGPDISEAFLAGTDQYQLAYYRTQRDISDGITTKAECTALLYLNRRLIAVGPQAQQQFEQAKPARP